MSYYYLVSLNICEKGFAALLTFRERDKHSRVSQTYKEGDYKLGIWVAIQRSNKDKLTQERRQRLDNIGFVLTVKN